MADTPTVATNPDVFTKAGDTNTKKQLRNVSGTHNSEFTDELVLTDSPSVIWDTSQPGRAIAYVAEIDPDTGLPIPSTNNGKHNILSPTHPDTLPDTLVSGDVLYADATNKLTRLPKGSDTQVLTLAAGLPSWAAGGGGSGTVTSIAGGTGITNNPEPITTTGTIDLDIHSLTSTTVATGDEIPVQDVSVGNAVGDQRRTTAGAIAALGYGALLDAVHNTDTTASAVTKGDLIIGNSTPEWDDLAIGSTGDVLTVVSGLPAWVTPVTPAGCDRRNCMELMEYFVGSRASAAGTSSTALKADFNYGWDFTSANTGTMNNAIAGAVALVNDIRGSGVALSTGSSAAGGICASIGFRPVTITEDSGEGSIIYETAFSLEDLSNGSHRYIMGVGLGDYTTGTACASGLGITNYINLTYSDNVNSGKFLCGVKGSGTTTVDSGVTAAADTWYTLRITLDSTHSTINWYLDTAVPPNLTSSPVCTYNGVDIADGTGMAPWMAMVKTVGTSGDRQLYVNYMYLRVDFTTGR